MFFPIAEELFGKFWDRLETEIRGHLKRYVDKFDEATDKKSKDLLEYKVGDNLAIDRDLLASYLSPKATRANNALQKWLAFFAAVALIPTILVIFGLLK